jgi:hypothetical protein
VHHFFIEAVMSDFIVRPIGREITTAVRTEMVAPQYGHPVHREQARGTGPCRECLSTFTVGSEDRLLFTYNPFAHAALIPQPGPVFIHAEACQPFAGNGYPDGLRALPIVAEAHLLDGTRSTITPLLAGDEGTTLDELLRDPHVRFVHLRHAEAGCYIARAERVYQDR